MVVGLKMVHRGNAALVVAAARQPLRDRSTDEQSFCCLSTNSISHSDMNGTHRLINFLLCAAFLSIVSIYAFANIFSCLDDKVSLFVGRIINSCVKKCYLRLLPCPVLQLV
jgi:hypothetical protein